MKIERFIYIGDIHSANTFKSFIDYFDDGKTFFYLLGDVFDRWDSSAVNFEIIKKLHQENKLKGIFWNHDLMFAIWLNKNFKDKYIKDTYLGQLENSGWLATLKDLKRYCSENYLIYEDYIQEICDFILNNFNLYIIDSLNNLLIHGWFPVNENGYIWWESIEVDKEIPIFEEIKNLILFKEKEQIYLEGLERMDYLNKWIKNLDSEILDHLSLNNPKYLYHMVFDTYKFNNEIIGTNEIYERTHDEEVNPLRFNGNDYFKVPKMLETLKVFFKNKNINKLILWHQWFYKELEICKEEMIKNNIYLIDRSFKNISKEKGKNDIFGYMIVDRKNNLIDIKEYWN